MNQLAGLRELVGEMNAGTVEFLMILGGNPVYTAPADLNFAQSILKVPLRAHLGLYEDETAAVCQWQIPETHFLEMWSDVRADDGTVTIIQPLIAPLYNGKSAHETMSAFSDLGERSGYDIVREFWSGQSGLSTQVRRLRRPPRGRVPRPRHQRCRRRLKRRRLPVRPAHWLDSRPPARRHRQRLPAHRCLRSRISIARGANGCTTA